MAEYTVINPKGIRIKSLLLSDIQGMHTLLKKEGCIDSENKFSDEQKAIALDEVQTRIAQQNKTDKQASADVLQHQRQEHFTYRVEIKAEQFKIPCSLR